MLIRGARRVPQQVLLCTISEAYAAKRSGSDTSMCPSFSNRQKVEVVSTLPFPRSSIILRRRRRTKTRNDQSPSSALSSSPLAWRLRCGFAILEESSPVNREEQQPTPQHNTITRLRRHFNNVVETKTTRNASITTQVERRFAMGDREGRPSTASLANAFYSHA